MLRINDIQNKLFQIESGLFQKICDLILSREGYKVFKHTGSVIGKNKTRKGTPDSVYIDNNNQYIYVEMTTQDEKGLFKKIRADIEKCLKKINDNPILEGKISTILYFHNQANIEESLFEEIKLLCGNIKLEIYGIEYLSDLLQKKYCDIAIEELGVKNDFQTIYRPSDDTVDDLAQALYDKITEKKESNNTIKEIKNKILKLYSRAIDIINNNDAIVFIGAEDIKELKSIYDGLQSFDFYFADKTDEDSFIYYYNMFVILSKIDYEKSIKCYESMPNSFKNNNSTLHLYSALLIEKQKLSEAETVLNQLYYEKGYKDALTELVRVTFLQKNYKKVIELLSDKKIEVYDRFGFLASILVAAKDKNKRLSYAELMKYNNSKFNKMPLLNAFLSTLMYKLDKRKKQYKEQFKKAFKYIKEDDILAIFIMCDYAREIDLEKYMIDFLEKINLSPNLQIKLLDIYSRQKELAANQIELVEKLLECHEDKVDKFYLLGKIAESKGTELEAINDYKESFTIKKNPNALYSYFYLSIKNKSNIEESLIEALEKQNNFDFFLLASAVYKYIGKNEYAIKCLYKGLYLCKDQLRNKEILSQFWLQMAECENKEEKNYDYVTKDSVVIMSSKAQKRIYVLEEDEFFKEKEKIMGVEIIRPYSDLGIELLQLKKHENISFNNTTFTITNILDKYSYFAQLGLEQIRNNQEAICFTSDNGDINDAVENLRKEMIAHTESIKKRLDTYTNKKLPLSALLSDDNEFDEYAKLINTLLTDSRRVFLVGESINLDLSDGFVIDITSLIVLSFFDILDIFPTEYLPKILITESLKNKFKYFYRNIIMNSSSVEKNLYLVENNELYLKETSNIQAIAFWKKLNNLIEQFTVVSVEMQKNTILNDRTIGKLDKVQFDSIELAKVKELPFICDDLAIRRLSNYFNVKHTNTISIIQKFSETFDQYTTLLKKYAEKNYIYALHENELVSFSGVLFWSFSEENKMCIQSIIEMVLRNEASINYYRDILTDFINRLEHITAFNYLGEEHRKEFISFFQEVVKSLLKI